MTTGVIGFDLSLTAAAACALPRQWTPGNWKPVRTWLYEPAPPKTDDLIGQLKRYEMIAQWAAKVVGECCALGDRPLCFVENYGFSKSNTAGSRLMESGGIVKLEIYKRWSVVLHPVAQNTARKLLLGKLPAPVRKGQKPKRGQKPPLKLKDHVQDILFNKLGAPKRWDDNQADAFVIANWGISEAGGRCLTLARR